MKFLGYLFFLGLSDAAYISLKYYSDTACKVLAAGVSVRPQQCIETPSGSAWVSCSSSQGLTVSEWSTSNCTGESNTTVTVTGNADDTCSLGAFTATSYYQVPLYGYKLKCNDDSSVRLL